MVRAAAPAVLAVCLAGMPALAAAERRAFTRTFEYGTQTAGDTALELDSTQTRSSFADGSPQAFELRLTIEHGVTERFDLALVHVLAQTTCAGTPADPGAPLHLDEVMVRARRRFVERGEWPFDTAVHAEAGKLFGASVYRGDARLVLGRDLGLVTVALNPRLTVRGGADLPTVELAAGWAAGASVEVAAELRAGAETWGDLDVDAPDRAAAALGPALAWAPTPSLWVTVTAGFGLTPHTPDVSVRALVGLLL